MTISCSNVNNCLIGTRPVGYIEFRKAWNGLKLQVADAELKKSRVSITCKIHNSTITVELLQQQKRINEISLPLQDGSYLIYLETSRAIGSYGVEYIRADKCSPYKLK
jgi:hypothetical protein